MQLWGENENSNAASLATQTFNLYIVTKLWVTVPRGREDKWLVFHQHVAR